MTQTSARIDLRKFDFQAQFQRCVEWNDPEQWDALAILYYQRGHFLNAVHCFQQADQAREAQVCVAMETEA